MGLSLNLYIFVMVPDIKIYFIKLSDFLFSHFLLASAILLLISSILTLMIPISYIGQPPTLNCCLKSHHYYQFILFKCQFIIRPHILALCSLPYHTISESLQRTSQLPSFLPLHLFSLRFPPSCWLFHICRLVLFIPYCMTNEPSL